MQTQYLLIDPAHANGVASDLSESVQDIMSGTSANVDHQKCYRQLVYESN